MRELEIAKNIIIAYLSTGNNIASINELYEIRSDNKELLREHINALKNIFEAANKIGRASCRERVCAVV